MSNIKNEYHEEIENETRSKSILQLFFESKKESEWNLLNQDQQTQLISEFEVWEQRHKQLNTETK